MWLVGPLDWKEVSIVGEHGGRRVESTGPPGREDAELQPFRVHLKETRSRSLHFTLGRCTWS